MQLINVAILNGWFMLSFLGAPVLTLAAGALHIPGNQRAMVFRIGMAAVLVVAGLVITMGFNVPLNKALAAAGEPGRITEPATVRQNFETIWVLCNVARAVTYTAAFGFLTWALVLYGRITATT